MLLVILASLIGASQAICPPADWIAPHCTCWNNYGDAMMTCSHLFNPDELVKPLQQARTNKYHIFSLQIDNSSLLYIPHNAFKGASFERIRFYRSEIRSLSDIDIAFDGLEDKLEELRAAEASYVTQWDWQQLRRMHNLRLIDISSVNMGSVDEPFPPLKNLHALGITKAGITHIVQHAFENLSGLRILNLMYNSIREISRSMLPNPAPELTFLDLSNNEISTLPTNLFSHMPHLVHVGLADNRLTVLPEATFKWAVQNLQSLFLGGNKFICDCEVRWILNKNLPYEFTASCAKPKSLAGKAMRVLGNKDFHCP